MASQKKERRVRERRQVVRTVTRVVVESVIVKCGCEGTVTIRDPEPIVGLKGKKYIQVSETANRTGKPPGAQGAILPRIPHYTCWILPPERCPTG